MTTAHRLSRRDARRIAIRAQLLDESRPTDMMKTIRHLTMVQLDGTSAVAPSADLVLWSRLGSSYSPAALRAALEKHTVVDLRGKDFKACGRQYMDETRAFRVTGRPFFTDKLPNNFSHVGLLHLILPNARVINARRHPFDSLLGGYKQLFGKGQNFTYDMADLSAYYRQYYETMRHFVETGRQYAKLYKA